MEITVVRGDITEQAVEAIVTAANTCPRYYASSQVRGHDYTIT